MINRGTLLTKMLTMCQYYETIKLKEEKKMEWLCQSTDVERP